jgi:50S ribosomal subunit-associated GTPase HflX
LATGIARASKETVATSGSSIPNAQERASIIGTVSDSSGAVLPGVTVEAASPALIERTRVLVHLVEPFPPDGCDPQLNYQTVRRELELHDPRLIERPEVVAVSKAELTGSGEVRERLERELGRDVLAISAVTGQGLAQLVSAIVERLVALPAEV